MAHRPSAWSPALDDVVPPLAPPAAARRPTAWRLALDRAHAALADCLLAERERWFLWLPVGLGLGVAGYFALPVEPAIWLGPALLAPTLIGLALAWHAEGSAPGAAWRLPLLMGLVALALGFTAGSLRSWQVAAPTLERRGAHMVEGRVLLVEDRVGGRRLLLGEPVIEALPADRTPARVRVGVRGRDPVVWPGDRVRLRAMLLPPSPPVAPHGFDFARQAFFDRLGAVGYALSRLEVVATADATGLDLALARVRQRVAGAIGSAVEGPSGAVAVALLTGLRGAIPDRVWQDMQAAGIAHLLAISGLHLGLVAGTLFFAARIAIALCPPVALRIAGKKVAAGLALAGAFAYLLLTGATVPTQRAFVMTALMLLAVMVDRNPFSMRLVAWAALVVLLRQPESLLGASFQMSFAAVVALIAAYETGAARRPEGAGGLDWRLALYVGGVALTTVVATLATAPLAVYHFGRLPTYGIVANLIAVPLTAFWIMPTGLLGLILLPLGLGATCFALMGHGIDLVLVVAATVADWPGAAVRAATPPALALVAAMLGGLWLCLWRTRWRRHGLLGVVLGIVIGLLHEPPDLLVDAGGQLLGVRLEGGRLTVSPWQRDRWVTNGWLRLMGQDDTVPWPADGAELADLRCDPLGCVLVRDGITVAYARRPEALEEDCQAADLVIAYPRVERCPTGTHLIGPQALRGTGGLALWLDDGEIRLLTVREVRGERPWVR